ncbi:hypothetical protein ABMA27_015028 [Loxostege sticticalis]|uniref:MADF domain-containing protein n=1 Tax=Loxostege sticticalis TaxID=481309 RepID=A0ABR3IB04_LOXSC
MASTSSGRVIMTEFIEKYRNSECLWKVTDKNYKTKQHRQKALEELLLILKKIDSTANLDSVTKKINSMRSAFNKEHNKVKAACRSGIGAEDEYIPKLWYYDLLLFLNERDTEVGSSRDINAILNEENDKDKDQIFEKRRVSFSYNCSILVLHDVSSEISSANKTQGSSTIFGRSLIYIKNRRQPATLPCGIDAFNILQSERTWLIILEVLS